MGIDRVYSGLFFITFVLSNMFFVVYILNNSGVFNNFITMITMFFPLANILLIRNVTISKKDIVMVLFLLYFIVFGSAIGYFNGNPADEIFIDALKIFLCMSMLLFFYAWYPEFSSLQTAFLFIVLLFETVVAMALNAGIIINFTMANVIFLVFIFSKKGILRKVFMSFFALMSKKIVIFIDLMLMYLTSMRYRKYVVYSVLTGMVFAGFVYAKDIVTVGRLLNNLSMVQTYSVTINDRLGSVGDRLFEAYYSVNGMKDSSFTKIFGMGNGYVYKLESSRRLGDRGEHKNVHISVINLYSKYGVVGIAFFIYLGWVVFRIYMDRCNSFYKRGMVSIFYVGSFFSFTIFNMFVAWAFLSNKSK